MTETTIDLATTAINVGSAPDTVGPGNARVCHGKPPFDKSLQEAMSANLTAGDISSNDIQQDLPPARQELPPDGTFCIDGIQEVRALADAIFKSSSGFADQSSQLLISGKNDIGATASVVALTPAVAEQFDDEVTLQTQHFKDTMAQNTRPLSADTLLVAGNGESKEVRKSLMESQNGISLAAQETNRPIVHIKEVHAPQPPTASKQTEVVSSTELATHLRVLKSSGGGEARLQLHPAELGRMTVTLITEGNEARVSFVVENVQAKQAVDASLHRLRDLMDGAGLNLADADVANRDADKDTAHSDEQMSEDGAAKSPDGGDEFDQSDVSTVSHLIDAFA